MCRGMKNRCVLLGDDPSRWDPFVPMPPPEAVTSAFSHLAVAIEAASQGRLDAALNSLRKVREAEIRDWYVEHAQIAGRCRLAVLRPSALTPFDGTIDERANPSATMAAEVLIRDGHRCRYCQRPVITRRLLKAFQSVVGEKVFPMGSTNATTHGAAIAFRAVADHVVPRKRGGRTDVENLVTSCWPCNFGKAGYTVEQLGLSDPRSRAVQLDWNGLEHLVPLLKSHAS